MIRLELFVRSNLLAVCLVSTSLAPPHQAEPGTLPLEGYSQDEGKTLVAIRATPSQIVASKEAKFKAFEPQLHEQLYELVFSVLKCDLAKLFCWLL